MSGQSVMDRFTAARYSIAGQGLAKSVCKSTTEEVMGPKKKHLDYLIQCTNEPNVSIPQLANLLIERTQSQAWVVVFKALISIHNLMNYGNERFTQYLASNNCTFNLGSFLDKNAVQGYDMSTYIRRYSKYLNEKAFSYRQMAYDFCKVKRGKDDGMLRSMSGEKLLKALPVLQQQMDALLAFDVNANELTNGVINAAFMLLFKDLIRLFACYNDGIINLLEKYFDMNKKQCREALEVYKKFLIRMETVSEFLKVAENVGIDKGDIPDLAKAPSSLLEALEEHLKSLESTKKGGGGGGGAAVNAPRPEKVTTAINSFAAATAAGTPQITEEDKKRILDEESRQLQQLKEEQIIQAQSPTGAPAAANNPFASQPPAAAAPVQNVDLFSAGSPTSTPQHPQNMTDDLFSLSTPASSGATAPNPFASSPSGPPPAVTAAPMNNPFASPAQPTGAWVNPAGSGQASHSSSFVNDAQFVAAFGNATNSNSTGGMDMGLAASTPPMTASPGFDGFGEMLRPTTQTSKTSPSATSATGSTTAPTTAGGKKLISKDLDSSLAILAGNLSIDGAGFQPQKNEMQWTQAGEKKLTGGINWSQPGAPPPTGMMGMGQQPAMNMQQPGMVQGGMQPQQMGYQQPVSMGIGQPQVMGIGGQPNMYGQQANQQSFGQQRPPAQPTPSDPFGAL